jgi:anti-sigma regulatory factor (Ser/Thr protein kinase)
VLEATIAVEAHPAAVGEARRFLRRALSDAGVDEEVVDVVLLLASEVITNAVIHARSSSEIRVMRLPAAVRVEVADTSKALPERRVFDFESASGRGLAIVDAVAARWGVEAIPGDGKFVWFEVAA